MKTGGVNDGDEYEHGVGLSVRRDGYGCRRAAGWRLAGYRYADERRAERELREVGESVGHRIQRLTPVKAIRHSAGMAEPIHEVLPGVFHWSARHPSAGIESASHYLEAEGLLLDPIAPPDGLEWFDGRELRGILLTNRHHTRSAFDIQDRFRVTIRAPRTGMHDLPEDRVEPYDFGEELAGGITPHAISETWPDETALHIPAHRAVAIADGVHNYEGLGYFPDNLLGDDPEAEKRRLREGFAKLTAEVDFDHLLLAHGPPIIGNGRELLGKFVAN